MRKRSEKRDKYISWIRNVAGTLFTLLVVMFCVVILQAGRGEVPYIFGCKYLKIVSDSMEPAIDRGTCIIIRKIKEQELAVGDIITFISEAPDIRGFYNTHRITHIVKDDITGEHLYITKGDAADEDDTIPVRYEKVVGRYCMEIPFGKLLYRFTEMMKDSLSYFVIVIVPLILCLLSYLWQLWRAVFPGKEREVKEEDEEG